VNQDDDKKIRELLRRAIPPVRDTGLQRDLWPQMLKKFDESAGARVPWFDLALAAAPAMGLVFFPEMIPVFLYLL